MVMLRALLSVLIMECTYKTNKYRMLLLEIMGLTCTDLTFYVIFVYLQHEREDNFVWALGVLRSVVNDSALPNVIVTNNDIIM